MVIFLSRTFRLGGGSNFPGKLALRLCPGLLRTLAAGFKQGTVVVTATNGKTTTTRMIAGALKRAGVSMVYNISGANMETGITTALIEHCSLLGKVRAELGLFEVDEGSLPVVAPQLAPRLVLVGNFFRDQLDRYGEVAILARKVGETLAALPRLPHLILNGDDPIVTSLGYTWQGKQTYFGLDDVAHGLQGKQEEADIRHCLFCGAELDYNTVYLGHQGDFYCTGCDFARPALDYRATQLQLKGLDSQSFMLIHGDQEVERFSLQVPGDHSVYNMLGALAVLAHCGVPPLSQKQFFAEFKPPYGRFERFSINGHDLFLVLMKNPAGANVILRLFTRIKQTERFVLFLNDLSADGRDISWIYDAQFEHIKDLTRVVAGGRRAEDIALRLVYAGVPPERVCVEKDYDEAIAAGLADLEPGRPVYVLATYTAMHLARAALAKRTQVSDFWKD